MKHCPQKHCRTRQWFTVSDPPHQGYLTLYGLLHLENALFRVFIITQNPYSWFKAMQGD
jgi:hypothetical protein